MDLPLVPVQHQYLVTKSVPEIQVVTCLIIHNYLLYVACYKMINIHHIYYLDNLIGYKRVTIKYNILSGFGERDPSTEAS